MKHSLKSRVLSAVLTCTMLLTTPVGAIKAAAADTGKYISEVFIAYGSTEDKAKSWLTSHGWEPVEGNFNAGKDEKVAAVMGVKRTNDPNAAVTDMAVMNMGTEGYMGYSFDDYQKLLEEKKADIDEFVDSFMPVIEEYRANYKGDGSPAGKARAELAYDMLNKFYDGEIDGQYAVNDTGMPLGDLFLNTTRRELGEDKYDALSKNEQVKYGDLQQIILESSGPALLAVEQALVMAADTGEEPWLERLTNISGLPMHELAELYADGSASLSDSAAESLVMLKYGDAASTIAAQYDTIRSQFLWYRAYKDANGLWVDDGETEEAYAARISAYFEELEKKDEALYNDVSAKYTNVSHIYDVAALTPYAGDWGDTLLDFYTADLEDAGSFIEDTANFLPFALALSDGQRAGLRLVSFDSLLLLGYDDEQAFRDQMSSLPQEYVDLDQISIYTGSNRTIFRDGVALTSRALMEKSRSDPYGDLWDNYGMISMLSYVGIGVGVIGLVTGGVLYKYCGNIAAGLAKDAAVFQKDAADLLIEINQFKISYPDKVANINKMENFFLESVKGLQIDKQTVEANLLRIRGDNALKITQLQNELQGKQSEYALLRKNASEAEAGADQAAKMSSAGRWIMGIGGALMLAAGAMKGYQLYKYYNRTFTPIPLYIVDEADIVSYTTDKNGNEVRNIDFNQYVYYEVVKCNRQDIGVNSKAQDGVDQYAEWGCGDAADLNCDI
nr:hypothetical protein [Oscillospiraceae bacterium]